MDQKKHFTGLTDTQVTKSREIHGANILTLHKKYRCGNFSLKNLKTPSSVSY
ncbi:MAG: cation-transporting P-type ATPase [Barnesiella sp.]